MSHSPTSLAGALSPIHARASWRNSVRARLEKHRLFNIYLANSVLQCDTFSPRAKALMAVQLKTNGLVDYIITSAEVSKREVRKPIANR